MKKQTKMGRPKGSPNKALKLDKYHNEIMKYMKLNLSKTTIARLTDCNVVTLNGWLKKKKILGYKTKSRKAK